MSYLNIEIKARTTDADYVRTYLEQHHADYKGLDIQTDTEDKSNGPY